MDKVLSYEQIQGFVSEIRSLNKGFVSNFFWDSNKHPYWLAAESLTFVRKEACILMLHQQESFCNLFYISTDMETACLAISSMSFETVCVVDVVCKGEGEEERKRLQSVGFLPYRHLFRMSHVGLLADDTWEQSQEVEYGVEEDINALNNALRDNFDPLSEQLPSVKELSDYIKRKQVLVIKDGSILCGFIIFELIGMTWYLRYWFTSSLYRNKGIGAKLLKSSLFQAKSTKRQILWVISDNENAIKRYEHYGFKREMMNDYVFIKK